MQETRKKENQDKQTCISENDAKYSFGLPSTDEVPWSICRCTHSSSGCTERGRLLPSCYRSALPHRVFLKNLRIYLK